MNNSYSDAPLLAPSLNWQTTDTSFDFHLPPISPPPGNNNGLFDWLNDGELSDHHSMNHVSAQPNDSFSDNGSNNSHTNTVQNHSTQPSPFIMNHNNNTKIRAQDIGQHVLDMTSDCQKAILQYSTVVVPTSDDSTTHINHSNYSNIHQSPLQQQSSINSDNSAAQHKRGTHQPVKRRKSSDTDNQLIDEVEKFDVETAYEILSDKLMTDTKWNFITKQIAVVESALLKNKKFPILHINMFLAYVSTTLHMDQYSQLLKLLLSRPSVLKVVSAVCDPAILLRRRFTIDWSRSPSDALRDDVLRPNLPMLCIQTHAMKSVKLSGNTRSNMSILDKPSTPIEDTDDANDDSAMFEMYPLSKSSHNTDDDMCAEEEKKLVDVVRTSELIEVQRSCIINREFERTFGYTQRNIQDLCQSHGTTILSIFLAPVRTLYRSLDKYLQNRTSATRQTLIDAQQDVRAEVLRISKLHHSAVSNIATQFTTTVNMNTANEQIIKCGMAARAIYSNDGMIIAWYVTVILHHTI